MTEVRIHGYLSKFFDLKIKVHLGRLNDVFRAICAIKTGFREKIIARSRLCLSRRWCQLPQGTSQCGHTY